jgi:hypothetical protein
MMSMFYYNCETKISSIGICPHYNMGSMGEKKGFVTEIHNTDPFSRTHSFFNTGASCISQFTHSLLTKKWVLVSTVINLQVP